MFVNFGVFFHAQTIRGTGIYNHHLPHDNAPSMVVKLALLFHVHFGTHQVDPGVFFTHASRRVFVEPVEAKHTL